MAGKPLWRQAFDAVDRRVSGPVEAGARSDAFTDVLTVGWRISRPAQQEMERRTRRVLHMANLPTAAMSPSLAPRRRAAPGRARRRAGAAARAQRSQVCGGHESSQGRPDAEGRGVAPS